MTCADCGQEFSFTAGEQEFYAQRGFTESPKRCPSCRQIRKAQRSREGGSSRGDSYGGSSRYGDGGGSSNGGYGDSSYGSGSGGYGNGGGYSSAGYSPSGGYSAGGGYSGGGYSSGSSGSSERRSREMFDAVCANCGKTASVPFRPSGSKPVYCSDCFESRR